MTATAATVIAALHVSQRIKDYGSYAGFACVLGLAVLALLYFAQAREVKRLREWAGRAPERDADLQARVTAQAQQRAATPPTPAPAAPTAAAAATAAGAATAATPAGQAGQAAAKPATPAGQPAAQPAAQPGQQQPAPKPGVPAPATAAAATAAGAASASPASAKPDTPPSGDGAATSAPSTPLPATPAGANGAVDQPTQITPAPAGATATPKPTPRPGQPLRPPAPAAAPPADEDHHGSRRTALMIAGGALALVVIAVVLILTVFTGGSSKNSPNTIGNSTTTTPSSSTTSNGTKPAPISRGDVTVAVLNGTTVPGLARGAATKLQNAGFKIGTVTNAPDQARSATIVAYQPGHEAEARVVAKLIHVGTDAVKPIDQSTAVVAGQDAFVVVTVGADQSQ